MKENKIGFFTGIRSEYGIMKKLITKVNSLDNLSFTIYVSGTHLKDKFGNTLNQIKEDGFDDIILIDALEHSDIYDAFTFSTLLNKLTRILEGDLPKMMFVFGDRVEAYATAIASHFLKIPVAHFGGGVFTNGAVDNIYRYNISMLADLHFVTSSFAREVLANLPIIDSDAVYNVGSLAAESIIEWKQNPIAITKEYPFLKENEYVLMTFHPVTKARESVVEIMRTIVQEVIKNNNQILITYPNNDEGFEEIIDEIERLRTIDNVYITKSLGSYYYAAIHSCKFVIGNSSSGIIEVPYFNKPSINVGERQSGRGCEKDIIHLPADAQVVKQRLREYYRNGITKITNNYLYGRGNTSKAVISIIKKYLSID